MLPPKVQKERTGRQTALHATAWSKTGSAASPFAKTIILLENMNTLRNRVALWVHVNVRFNVELRANAYDSPFTPILLKQALLLQS